MTLSNPHHLLEAVPLNTVVGLNIYPLNILPWALSFTVSLGGGISHILVISKCLKISILDDVTPLFQTLQWFLFSFRVKAKSLQWLMLSSYLNTHHT
jgi:hypothetical protein